jgi:DNA-binding transcriptional ArsR family regulator
MSLHTAERANSSSPAPDDMAEKAREASAFLKLLANESRLMILCLLCEGERSVTEIERALGRRQPAVSQQLARLRSEGLVAARRAGKTMHYRLVREDVRVLVGAVHEVFCRPDRTR